MNFDVAGPFKLKRHGNKKLITQQSIADLRAEMEKRSRGLSKAVGCYVFVIHAGKGYTPYYVGQARRKSLLMEALNPSNLGKYNNACSDSNGNPFLFFLPMRTPSGHYRKKGTGGRALDFLERWLIAAAIAKNEDLINTKETRLLRKLTVVGVFNAKKGKPTASSRELKRALGLK
jgi:hypothetical protein